MIAIAEDIFEEIDSEVILLNGEVVRRAMANVEEYDNTCCGYFNNTRQFRELIEQYETALRIARLANDRMLSPLTIDESLNSDRPIWRIRQTRFVYSGECDRHRDELRAKLHKIWPCNTCMIRDNPTERKRRD